MDNIQAEINKEEDDREQEEKDSGAIHVIFYPIEFFFEKFINTSCEIYF